MAGKQPKSIEDLLKLLSMGEALTETQQKTMNDYKFWKTQPVPALDEVVSEEGPIDTKKNPRTSQRPRSPCSVSLSG
ncbi:hypothetical protein OXX59_010265 [Metschnikowia pulcherrima]